MCFVRRKTRSGRLLLRSEAFSFVWTISREQRVLQYDKIQYGTGVLFFSNKGNKKKKQQH